ncbi:2-polyprenyl-3-methyl-5-hydroxy-6-metoxy-1,4-benzoquinol methylase [Natronoarchaeum philippinense]|uniref:2-polyprenyl-3-methyl-5-hydroxy-6-metoxy-1,4-benzoquinol methylase n=1 Tax=Natronoarchaeum philippinense TaxID=558529 RepID=A0A285NQL5_NATPI|nr:class I SAM-dependent methyltransferase [Natronoarchaeum philippinense]SNZ11810.1 2-polyprenyl-3-methyl-5-hydroxy-6-metoxy-1,4-benzoquinol methylase [Natronoarchaeum philippinense]
MDSSARERSGSFGRMVVDYHEGDLVEQPRHRRDDGEESEAPLEWYFTGPEAWPEVEHDALADVRGRVLDAGCGVGRTALWLQDRGNDVVGIDRSPGAVAVARDRGVERAVVGDMGDPALFEDAFDTVLVAGQQIGVGGDREGVRDLLDAFAELTGPDGRLIADVSDPTAAPAEFREYLGDVSDGTATRTFRTVYDGAVGEPITLFMVSPAALDAIVAGTPWSVETLYGVDDEGGHYYFVLEKA